VFAKRIATCEEKYQSLIALQERQKKNAKVIVVSLSVKPGALHKQIFSCQHLPLTILIICISFSQLSSLQIYSTSPVNSIFMGFQCLLLSALPKSIV